MVEGTEAEHPAPHGLLFLTILLVLGGHGCTHEVELGLSRCRQPHCDVVSMYKVFHGGSLLLGNVMALSDLLLWR